MSFFERRLGLLRHGFDPAQDVGDAAHRQLQTAAEAFVYRFIAEPRPDLVDAATRALAALRAQQAPDGLFTTGDNLASPPDSSFTVNGLCRLLRVIDAHPDPALRAVRDQAATIVLATASALVRGGVHTPNHRWEISCALVQLWHLFGDTDALARARQWLAEGIDLQPDGLFSERSPNYAVHVSGPCLLEMARLLERPDLAEAVHTHLHAILPLVDSDDHVDTTPSRRQDQRSAFPLAHYALLYRRLAVARDCATCAAMAERGERSVVVADVDAVAQCLLDPAVGAELTPGPVPEEPPGWRVFQTSQLAVWRRGTRRIVTHAASDVARVGRVSSGLSADPTFLAVESDDLRLGVRLSREFFNLGPFRADSLRVDGSDVILDERVEAHYYQPLSPEHRRPDGAYELEFEGRFAAEMSFSERERDTVALRTSIRITPTDAGVDLLIGSHGSAAPHVLELALRGRAHPGAREGSLEPVDERTLIARGEGTLADGRLALRLDGDFTTSGAVADYNPGETYRFLHGSDAVPDARLLVGFSGPGTRRVSLLFSAGA